MSSTSRLAGPLSRRNLSPASLTVELGFDRVKNKSTVGGIQHTEWIDFKLKLEPCYNLVNSSIRMFVKKSGLMAKSDISDFPIVENLLKDARGARSDCQERTGAGRPQVC